MEERSERNSWKKVNLTFLQRFEAKLVLCCCWEEVSVCISIPFLLSFLLLLFSLTEIERLFPSSIVLKNFIFWYTFFLRMENCRLPIIRNGIWKLKIVESNVCIETTLKGLKNLKDYHHHHVECRSTRHNISLHLTGLDCFKLFIEKMSIFIKNTKKFQLKIKLIWNKCLVPVEGKDSIKISSHVMCSYVVDVSVKHERKFFTIAQLFFRERWDFYFF